MDPQRAARRQRGQPARARRGSRRGIVANPNCTTMVIMLPLKALHDAFGLREMVATSFQAAGGAGQKGMDELAAQVPRAARGARAAGRRRRGGDRRDRALASTPRRSPTTSSPGSARRPATATRDEEMKLVNESRKILEIPDLRVSPTCVRVPVMVGHCDRAARDASSARPTSTRRSRRSRRSPGVVLDPLPTPVHYAGRDEVAVGRIRRDLADPHSLNLFVVGDNLLKGAALNAVQIAELLVARGLLAAARRRGRGVAAATRAATPATTLSVQSITVVGLTMWRPKPSSLGREAEREADELGQVQHRHLQLAPDDGLGERLLEVEVEVAQRAGRDDAVRLGVDGVAEVAAGLLERGRLVHRDDREAAALVRAGVVDHGAAERVDHLLEVALARVLVVDPQALGGPHDVAAVERADAQVGRAAA